MRPRPPDREPFFHSIHIDREAVPSWSHFPFNLPAIREMGHLKLHPAVTFFIGENGSGKSTLLEAMAVRLDFNEKGGEARDSFGSRTPDAGLHEALRITASRNRRTADRFFLRAETVYNVATELDERSRRDPSARDFYGVKSLHARSHGEAFLAIVQNRMRSESFFLLDEPEAALSPSRLLTLIKEMDWLVRSGCQFVIATHSPILMSYPDALMYELGDHGVRETTWKETEHYTLTKSFLDRPEAFLRHLVE